MTRLLPFALLALGSFAHSQDGRMQIALAAGNIAIGAVDAGQTCYHLAHGARELTLPTQSCGGAVGWIMGAKIAESTGQYLLWKHGHPKLAAAIPSIAIGASGIAIGYSFSVAGRRKR